MSEKVLVWAKMKSFCPWPGVIVNTPPDVLKRQQPKVKDSKCIFFFGSKNFAWIEDTNIHPYVEHRDRFAKGSKQHAFKEAIRMIEEYISDPETYNSHSEPEKPKDPDANFNKLRDNDDITNGNSDDDGQKSSKSAKSTKSAVSAGRRSAKKRPAAPARTSLPMKFRVTGKKSMKNDDPAPSPKTPPPRSPPPKRRRECTPPSSVRHEVLDVAPQRLIPAYPEYVAPSRSAAVVDELLNRPYYDDRTDTRYQVDMTYLSKEMRCKNIIPSSLTFGFLGLGIMGTGLVRNLIVTGHKVVVWNRTQEKCDAFVHAGAQMALTPADVVDMVDVTYSCVSDPMVAKELIFGNCGVLSSDQLTFGKGYVEMTGMDDATSQLIADAITAKGGRYVEAMMQGSKAEADDGTLVIISAGDKSLFDECQSCFEAMSKNSFYLGAVGKATRMYLSLQVILGNTIGALSEGMALAHSGKIDLKNFVEVLEVTGLASPMMILKGRDIINSEFTAKQPLAHLQKDMKLALNYSDHLNQPLPLTAVANEQYKLAKRTGYGQHDACALFIKARI